MHERQRLSVIGAPIDAIDWEGTLARIEAWAKARESRTVCICNVHSVVTARDNERFRWAVASADLATPDGAPIAWMMRRLGRPSQKRVTGPELMWRYCEAAAARGERIYLYGGRPATLETLQRRLQDSFPGLVIAGAYSPPFRPLTEEEDAAAVQAIVDSGATTVWVSLGCPKQEIWMAEHRGRIPAVMIGVGAAFDFHAGTVARAPAWMQRRGLEWLHRLASEPGRLWRRYLRGNRIFIAEATMQLWRERPRRGAVRRRPL